jgi:hypothetical protein
MQSLDTFEEMGLKTLVATVALILIAGCASYKPVPDGYAGPVASVADSGGLDAGQKAQLYVLSEVDGHKISESFSASQQASRGLGAGLITKFVTRQRSGASPSADTVLRTTFIAL